MSKKIVEITREIALKATEKFNLELVDVEFVTENKEKYLRIYIYKEEGVSIDDCTNVHHEVNKVIDEKIDYDGSYHLQISSPGYDRALKYERDFIRHMGELVNIKLYAPINGSKSFEGRLIKYNDGFITIDCNGEDLDFEVSKTSKVKRLFEFK